MIIKGQSRGRARQLAAHLLRADQNETIRLYETRGTVAETVPGALAEMEALGAGVVCQRPLYHASISPEAHTPLTDQQIGVAVETLGEVLGLENQPRVVVVHRKKNREHVHVVWSRIVTEHNRAIPDGWNYRHHEQASRALEALFGHKPIPNSSPRRARVGGSGRSAENYEVQQEPPATASSCATADITALWHASSDAETFRAGLEKVGYRLARGDRRVFVVIDRHGHVHSLARRIEGVSTRALRTFMQRIDMAALPSVAEVRAKVLEPSSAQRITVAFKAAAREVTGRRGSASAGAIRAAAERSATSAMREVFAWAVNAAPSGPPAKPIRMTCRIPNVSKRRIYTGMRGIIVAHFAVKIAYARDHLPREEVEAALAALVSEREAALQVLSESQKADARERRAASGIYHRKRARMFRLRRLKFRRSRIKDR